jgi:hypothetical protein
LGGSHRSLYQGVLVEGQDRGAARMQAPQQTRQPSGAERVSFNSLLHAILERFGQVLAVEDEASLVVQVVLREQVRLVVRKA